MVEVNPFDEVPDQEKNGEKKFYFIRTPEWKWVMTEDLDDDNAEPYYDLSGDDESRLFDCETDCPICGGIESMKVCANKAYQGSTEGRIRDWVCMSCDAGGDGPCDGYGEARIVPRDQEDYDHYTLPVAIVVSYTHPAS